jgi:hypothetical protein
LRCLVEKVVLDRREHDVASVRVVWRGGAVTDLEVKMKVNSIAKLTRGMEMRDRVLDLARDGMPDAGIATIFTSEGHRSPNGQDKVLPITVQRIRRAASIQLCEPRTRRSHDASLLSAPELASRLNIPVNWFYVQIRQKRLFGGSAAQRGLPLPGLPCRSRRGSKLAQPHDPPPRSQNLSASPGGVLTWVIEQH